jgi:hypothetical protein
MSMLVLAVAFARLNIACMMVCQELLLSQLVTVRAHPAVWGTDLGGEFVCIV